MSRYRKLTLISCAAVLALGLAACSSSGNNTAAGGGGDSGPTIEEQLTALQQQVAALREQLGLPADGNISTSITELQTQLSELRDQVKEQEEAAADKAAKDKAAKLNKLAVGIGVAGAEIDVRAPASRKRPEKAMDAADPYAISGWTGTSWTHKMGSGDSATTTTAVVYSRKQPSTPIAFNKKYTLTGSDSDMLSLTTPTSENMTHAKLVKIPGLPSNVNHPGVKVGAVNGVRGTFDGVAGLFTAPGSGDNGLSVGVDTKGVPSWTGADGSLVFKPDSKTATVNTPDKAYMALGWWLLEEADGDLDPEVAAWAGGAEAAYTTADRLTALQGEATFNGIAVGKYTHKTINTIDGGHFNATAELVADFGTSGENGTVTGTISNFMQDGESIGNGWMVQLGAGVDAGTAFDPENGASIQSDGTISAAERGALGTFGTQKTSGTWQASFYDDSRRDTMPGAIGGTFHIGQTSHPINMIGAFAATNSVKDQPE